MNKQLILFYFFMACFLFCACSCEKESNGLFQQNDVTFNDTVDDTSQQNVKLPDIDLSHWKVTLPIGNATSIKPPEILNYATNDMLKPYMYNDSIEGALVFFTKPGASTPNSSYSRTELREQIVAGSDSYNWTFKHGGVIKGRLRIDETSRDSSGKPHRVIVMQIHGRLTNEQRDLIGQKDNNAPPIMKVYWDNGYVRLKSKVLKNQEASYPDLLHTDAWDNDSGYTFSEYVGYEPFTIEIRASQGEMAVTLNEIHTHSYSGNNMQKWGVFENYFKAGNYLMATESDAFARLKYYTLEVNH